MTKPSAKIVDAVSKAKSRLLLDQPFFASIVLRRPIVFDTHTKTASMSARGTMRINPEFIKDMNVNQLQFLLAHEAMHYALDHFSRQGSRNGQAWNIACDQVINDTLIDAGVGEFIEGGVQLSGARNSSAEQLYQEPPEGSGGQGPGGIGEDLSGEDGPIDQAEAEALTAQIKVELLQAAKQAKAMGKLPSGVQRLIESIVNVRTPWHEILERHMTRMVRDDYSWQRPNRRTAHMGVYLPSKGYVPNMGEVVIGVDTSGSIGGPEIAEFQAHVNRILETCRPEKVTVLYCDAAVGSSEEYTVDELPIQFTKVTGGGGTAAKPVFDYIDAHGLEPECVVYLTDGYIPDLKEIVTNHPTVWLTTGSTDFPFGEVIKFER
jgi:predicted metal-dependent peptidase